MTGAESVNGLAELRPAVGRVLIRNLSVLAAYRR